MDRVPRRILVSLAVLMSATFAVLHAASVPQPATPRSPGAASGSGVLPAPDDRADEA